jgi:hypothetical protein
MRSLVQPAALSTPQALASQAAWVAAVAIAAEPARGPVLALVDNHCALGVRQVSTDAFEIYRIVIEVMRLRVRGCGARAGHCWSS